MRDKKITFVGCGNMGLSLIGGLLADGYAASALLGVDPDPDQQRRLTHEFGIRGATGIETGVVDAEVVVLAVKPQAIADVLATLRAALADRSALVLSVVAGVRAATIARRLGGACPVARVMPNTPALLRAGAAGMYADANVTAAQRRLVERVMQAVGVAVWLDDEALLDAVTAVSGSGPAYFFLLTELLEKIAVEMGLSAAQACALSAQTALGAARMMQETDLNAASLRRQVTSPGGATARALQTLEDGGLETLMRQALRAARARSLELARESE